MTTTTKLITRLEATRNETLKYFELSDADLDLTYGALRQSIIYATRLHYESKGHLEFVHSVTGARTLKDEMEKVASHNEHHLEHIRRALNLAHLTPFMNIVRRARRWTSQP
jgi:hypothetical protein